MGSIATRVLAEFCAKQADKRARRLRHAAREGVGLSRRHHPPVIFTEGTAPPCLKGNYWGWETKGGSPIYHPNAYAKVGWSNMKYRHSTLRVEVGRDWLGFAGL